MSSPLYKHTNDNSALKQRKQKSTNAAKSSTNLDTRTELADLVKRKAEIAVRCVLNANYHMEIDIGENNFKFRLFVVV